MSEVSATRSSFFLKNPNAQAQAQKSNALRSKLLQRNQTERSEQIKSTTGKDAKVAISDSIKDFARIKRSVDAAPEVDNSKKIEALKAQIKNGSYKVDYDGLADKMLTSEF